MAETIVEAVNTIVQPLTTAIGALAARTDQLEKLSDDTLEVLLDQLDLQIEALQEAGRAGESHLRELGKQSQANDVEIRALDLSRDRILNSIGRHRSVMVDEQKRHARQKAAERRALYRRVEFRRAVHEQRQILDRWLEIQQTSSSHHDNLELNALKLENDYRRTTVELAYHDDLVRDAEERLKELSGALLDMHKEVRRYDREVQDFVCPTRAARRTDVDVDDADGGDASYVHRTSVNTDVVTILQQLHRRVMLDVPTKHSAQALLHLYKAWLTYRAELDKESEALRDVNEKIAWYYEAQKRVNEILLDGHPSPHGKMLVGITRDIWQRLLENREQWSTEKLEFVAESACRKYKALTVILNDEESKANKLLIKLPS